MGALKSLSVPEEVVVPALIGCGLLTLGTVLLQGMVIIAVWFAIFTGLIGFGIGVLSIPVLHRTGVGYMPPSATPKLVKMQRFGDSWPLHLVTAAYYSYLTAFLTMVVTIGSPPWVPLVEHPKLIGIFSGLAVGLLFGLGQVWMSASRGYRIDLQLLIVWLFYGALLMIAGVFWDLFLPTLHN